MQSIKKTKRQEIPVAVQEAVSLLVEKVTASTNFVLQTEDTANFGTSKKDRDFAVEITNAESVKTVNFETDGEYKDGPVVNYSDGYMRYRVVSNWTWLIVENLIRGVGDNTRSVQTCYVRDKSTYLALREAVGLKAA